MLHLLRLHADLLKASSKPPPDFHSKPPSTFLRYSEYLFCMLLSNINYFVMYPVPVLCLILCIKLVNKTASDWGWSCYDDDEIRDAVVAIIYLWSWDDASDLFIFLYILQSWRIYLAAGQSSQKPVSQMSWLNEFTAHYWIIYQLLQPGSKLAITFM